MNVAHNGDSAIDLVRRNRYQIALLDFKLPGLNGLDLFRALRKLQWNLECIIITGFPASMTFDEVQTCGLRRVLPKPLDFPQLLALIANCTSDEPPLAN